MKFRLLVIFVSCISNGNTLLFDSQTCYDGLGCFENGYPWSWALRPVPPPASPEDINATFFLFHESENSPIPLDTWPNISFEGTPFNASLKTYFIVHGFASEVLNSWPEEMGRAIVSKERANAISVDWSNGAKAPNYFAAVSNTRTVGAEISRLILYIVDILGGSKENIHLLGHSLGAHVCSYASNGAQGVFKITGFDVAQPLFEGYDEKVHLDKSDACFVEAIHTDARPFIPFLGLGFIEPVGDIDYYVNGGVSQPGCSYPDLLPKDANILDVLASPIIVVQITACRHGRSIELYLETLKNDSCIEWGHQGTILNKFISTLTLGLVKPSPKASPNCKLKKCIPIGLNSTQYPARGSFLVRTEKSPLCILEPENNRKMAADMGRYLKTQHSNNMCQTKGIKID